MSEFVYVSSVEGKIVTRFPSLHQPVAQYVGARRVLPKRNPREKPGLRKETRPKIVWNTEEVVVIPFVEWNKYRREYRRAVADGALKIRTKEDHEKWLSKREEDSKKAKEAADKAAAEAKATAEQVEAKAAADPAGVGDMAPDATQSSSPAPEGSDGEGGANDESGTGDDAPALPPASDEQPQPASSQTGASKKASKKGRASQGAK